MSKKGDSNQKNQRIQVFARCRPLNSIEKRQGSPSIVEVIPEKKEISVKERNRRDFFFDKVFPPDTKQIAVYKSVVEPLIQEVLMGYNCTVFAYGQTGTGKTYTMEGERNNSQCSWEDDPGAGIIPRSLHQLFEELNKGENVEFCVRVSFLELYNEELFDLLGSTEFSKLRLYEDPIKKGSVIIQGLEEIPVNSKDEVYTILERGTARRQTAATMLNATSSRSHTVFSVTVHIKENTVDGEELLKTGKLNLVDLAGSENVGRSGAVDKRAREAGNINQSLLTLGRVITALIEKQPHVPYRESKLTRLLQDSLGGHTKTSIIATISPAQLNLDETISTLDYATKAKSITIKPEANQRMTKRALIKEYSEEIERLKKDLVALRSNEGFYIDSDNYMNMMNEIDEKSDIIKELQANLDSLKEEKELVDQDNFMTKEELFKRTQQYEEMSLKLAQTSQTLNCIKKKLQQTALQRDETEHLLNIHCNTEKKLSMQAQTLLQVAHQTTDDVNKLHEKLERKKKVEQTNEERSETFKIMYQKQFASLDDMVSELQSQQLHKLKDIGENLNELSNMSENFKQKFNDVLHVIDTYQNNSLEQFSLNLSNDTSSQEKWSSSTLNDIKSEKDGNLTEQQTFLTKTFPRLVEQLQSLQLEIEIYFGKRHEVLSKKINELHSTIKSDSENKRGLIRTVHTQLNSFHDHHKALLKELDEKSKSLETLMEEDDESFEKEREKLYLQLDNLCKSRQISKNKLKEKFAEVQSSSLSLSHDCTKLKPINEPLNMLLSLEKDSDAQLISLEEISNTFEIDEFTSKQNSANYSLKSMSSEVTNFLQNEQKSFISAFNRIENAITTNVSSIRANFDRNEEKRKEITSCLSDRVQTAVVLLEKQSIENVEKISETEIGIGDSKQQLDLFAEQLKKEILQRDLEFEKFIYEDLQKDIPTGMTPQRKNYEYPTDLAATSPDEKILQRVRSYRETNIAVTLPLDSSFEDHEEFKSPINQDATESTIVNTSFTDDEENLTGCDTESNASSMSDLSIDGLKNKENWKNFAKPSHLPKLKKSKKLPKSSSIKSTNTNQGRKPLYCKNP